MDIETAIRIKDEILPTSLPKHYTRARFTPLALAIKNSHLDVVLFLLEAGANVNKSGSIISNISLSCYQSNAKITEALIDYGAKKCANEIPLIIKAARRYDAKLANLLIQRGSNVDEIWNCTTAIIEAKKLIDISHHRYTKEIVEEAIKVCREETVKVLTGYAGAIEHTDEDISEMKVRRLQVYKLRKDIVRPLKKNGFNGNVKDIIEKHVETYIEKRAGRNNIGDMEKRYQQMLIEAFAGSGL